MADAMDGDAPQRLDVSHRAPLGRSSDMVRRGESRGWHRRDQTGTAGVKVNEPVSAPGGVKRVRRKMW